LDVHRVRTLRHIQESLIISESFCRHKVIEKRGYDKGRFSFNVKGGRCEKCKGQGTVQIDMNFLSDVYVECERCNGKRYNEETLQVKYKEKSIAEGTGNGDRRGL